ncbi:hypothetical protein BJ741DRAFT_604810 [Chytriomyces cf. hyalinus JEL632]|nr:hypothetical protein BJ741DRAFT_604810 [Chytriomyces cf. hyalinus JEL632]
MEAMNLPAQHDRVDSGIQLVTTPDKDEGEFVQVLPDAHGLLPLIEKACAMTTGLPKPCCAAGQLELVLKKCDEARPYIAVSHVWGTQWDAGEWTDPSLKKAIPITTRVKIEKLWINEIPSSANKNNLSKLAFLSTLLNASSENVWFDWKDNNQHASAMMHEQVRHLPEVYRNATLTVIIHTCSSWRAALKKSMSATSPEDIAKIFNEALNRSRYRSRVWTLQEETLSRTRCHVLADGTGPYICFSRQTFAQVIKNPEAMAGWDKSPEFSDLLDTLFGKLSAEKMSMAEAEKTFIQPATLANRSASVSKDLYFAIALPCGIDLGLSYDQSDREVLLVWAKYLLERNYLTTCWRGTSSRYHEMIVNPNSDDAEELAESTFWSPFRIPPAEHPEDSTFVIESFQSAARLTYDNLSTWNHGGLYGGELTVDGCLCLSVHPLERLAATTQIGWLDNGGIIKVYAQWVEFSPFRWGPGAGNSEPNETTTTVTFKVFGYPLEITVNEAYSEKLFAAISFHKGSRQLLLGLKTERVGYIQLLCATRQDYLGLAQDTFAFQAWDAMNRTKIFLC